jgi:hypothetical protein
LVGPDRVWGEISAREQPADVSLASLVEPQPVRSSRTELQETLMSELIGRSAGTLDKRDNFCSRLQ